MKIKHFIALFVIAVFSSTLKAQEDLVKYLPAGNSSAEKLISDFIEPSAHSIGSAINNGWYHSAKVHRKWGFDISVAANLVFINPEDEFFSFSGAGVNDVVIADTGDDDFPTMLGPEESTEYPIRQLEINDGSGNDGYQFNAPDGLEPGKEIPLFNAVLIPTLQVGLGLPKNTEVKLRFTPPYKISESRQFNWGIGVMHDLTQHNYELDLIPIDLSVFAGFIQHSGEVDLSGVWEGSDQVGDGRTNGFTGQIIVGKTLTWFSAFAGVGYTRYNLLFDVNGTYNIPTPSPLPFTDPFSYEFGDSGVMGKAGLRFKLGPIVLWGEYALFKVKNVLTLGFAVSSKE